MREIPLVSVVCLCYNHGKYIKDALDSILMQKTNFKFEIIIHDDASTDDSVLVIKQYYNKYPDVIVPILQTENQYSQMVDINSNYIFPKVRGKYIALCECDDYWIDELKLQKQVDWMEKYDEYSVCIHAAKKIDAKSRKCIDKMVLADLDTGFDLKDAINGLGSAAATNSFLYRAKYINLIENYKKILPQSGVGDYLLLVILSTSGKIHYINEIMSVYRANVDNSWTSRMSKSINLYIKYLSKHILLLENLYAILPKDVHEMLNFKIKRLKFKLLLLKGDIFLAKKIYPDLYNELSFGNKIKSFITLLILKINNSGRLYDLIINTYRNIKYE